MKDAAKYGGFEDLNGDDLPGPDPKEWDKDANGIPDTYFEADEGSELEKKLLFAFSDILRRTASGTSVSVLATSGEGEGALYQAYFFPTKYEGLDEKKWLGYLQGLFLDSFGNLREDTNQDGKLVLNQDKIVKTIYDPATNEIKIQKFSDADGNGKADSAIPDETVAIDQLKPIWEAGKSLALANAADRKIYTWLNLNHDRSVDVGEFREFLVSDAPTLRPYLRAATDAEAGNIINFIRGDQPAGMRDRKITIAGAPKVWKLGDIVYSTPTVVAAPKERYDLLYGDISYGAFYRRYKDRRNMVYVGANDGMLHAFNAGTYTPGDDPATPGVVEHGRFDPGTGRTLGQELWSFIPYNLLPHLKWLTMQEYTHVYYVDLKPKVTDVNFFTPDADHPNGWGTILIGGMRLGGGTMTVADAGFGLQNPRTFRSEYFVLDITNPELPPRLLMTFSEADLGFTTVYPAIIRVKETPPGTGVKWFMMVGSGPTTYDGMSTQIGRVKIVNLENGVLARTLETEVNAFMGDPIDVDANVDFTSDVAYIGNSYQSAGTWKGNMYRLSIQNNVNPIDWVFSTFYQNPPDLPGPPVQKVGGPIVAAPTAGTDSMNNFWVYFGTGRYFSTADRSDASQQRFYGIIDPCWNGTCTTAILVSDLNDASPIKVFAGGTVTGAGANDTFDKLLTSVRAQYASLTPKRGWFVNLSSKERVFTKSTLLGGIVFFTSFVPGESLCDPNGSSYLFGLYYETGSAYKESILGIESPTREVLKKVSLGVGLPSSIGAHIGSTGSGDDGTGGAGGGCKSGLKGFVQQSTGNITEICGTPAFSIRSGIKKWRENGL